MWALIESDWRPYKKLVHTKRHQGWMCTEKRLFEDIARRHQANKREAPTINQSCQHFDLGLLASMLWKINFHCLSYPVWYFVRAVSYIRYWKRLFLKWLLKCGRNCCSLVWTCYLNHHRSIREVHTNSDSRNLRINEINYGILENMGA